MSEVRPFHNVSKPRFDIKSERQTHRLACHMAINGYSQKIIAETVGYTEAWLSSVLRQPWALEYMAQEMQEKSDEMREQIMAEAKLAFAREVDLSKTAKSESVKHQANTYLIDRYLGKPTQPIEEINKKPSEMSDDELRKALPSLIAAQRAQAYDHIAPSQNESLIPTKDTTSEPFPLETGFSQ